VIQTTKAGKTTTYYLVDNDVSKAFTEDVCHGAKKVVAKGTIAEVDGKQQLTLSKIDIAKK
jgi:heme-binding NEAT domain protein